MRGAKAKRDCPRPKLVDQQPYRMRSKIRRNRASAIPYWHLEARVEPVKGDLNFYLTDATDETVGALSSPSKPTSEVGLLLGGVSN